MSRRAGLYIILAGFFLVAVTYQTWHSTTSVRSLLSWQEEARFPFWLAPHSPVVAGVQPEAERAGLKAGDRIETLNGIPLTGYRVHGTAVSESRAGDELRLTLQDGRALSIRLAQAREQAPGASDWSVTLVLQVLMPAVCLLLGFWVVASRPRDPIAWLLLALLVSFGIYSRDRGVLPPAGFLRDPAMLYQTLWHSTWAVWMMLFGIYFPERLVLDRRLPWVKWVLMSLVALIALRNVLLTVGGDHSFALTAPLYRLVAPFETFRIIVEMLCISVFFMGLGMKAGMTTEPDARRRLLLLYTGSSLGLTPVFLVVLAGLLRGTGPFENLPPWILFSTLLMLILFPLTLAYVIVVHRALDVRVVIRQGIRYAFARKGVQVLRVLLSIGILFAISAAASRPNTRQVDILRILGLGGFTIVVIGRVGESVIGWTDRRFFREALDSERILNDLSEKVRAMIETAPLVETVARTISESLHVPRVAFLLQEGDVYRAAFTLGYPGDVPVSFSKQGMTVRKLSQDAEPVRVYFDDPRSWVNVDSDPADPERGMLVDLGTQLLLPLAVKEKLPGFISLGSKLSEEPFSGADLRLLQSVATQAALALENSRLASAIATEVAQRERHNREVEIARQVQERLFPQSMPPVRGLDYSGHCRPALGVGGDYFDFLQLSDGRFGVAIADVSGKGIGAALMMASLQASLRGQTIQATDLARLIHNVNRLVFEATPDNRYATFFYGQYDPITRVFSFVNAGHCPPIILREDGSGTEVIRLKAGGTVIGLFSDSTYLEGSVTLRPGDLLLAYTDGISEALNPGDEEWGEERLIEAAGRCRGLGAAETIAFLIKETDAFVAGADQYDDMTLVALRVA